MVALIAALLIVGLPIPAFGIGIFLIGRELPALEEI
jgi:hypothetical protein